MKHCLLCGEIIRDNISFGELISLRPISSQTICHACWSGFNRLSMPTCDGCGRKLVSQMTNPCQDCIRWRDSGLPNLTNQALFEYNAAMKDFMKRYKFNGDYRLRYVFVSELRLALAHTKRLIVPIPVSQGTLATRGFNQVTGLLDRTHYHEVLKVTQDQKLIRQSEKNRRQRLDLIQPFELLKLQKNLIKDNPVLIVDDVYTTGTTIRHAAALLYQAGATDVKGLTLAR